MKRISLGLTWDGARWPIRTLPPKARAFLARKFIAAKNPTAREMAEIFVEDQVSEIRICWVTRLKGGEDVLSDPFQTPEGARLGFKAIKTIPFGDTLGVIYRRT